LILASTSIYRRGLLERLKLPFSCIAPNVDETALPGERAADLVVRLAMAKAAAVAIAHPDAWVIGSDQVAVRVDPDLGEVILGKPGNVERCREQLLACSGQMTTYFTGVHLMQASTRAAHVFTEITRVHFRQFDAVAVERYIQADRPLDCAGGLKSETLGITLCEAIDTRDPSALIGLPLIRLSAVLREAGFQLP
jgi:septum formation protein